MLSKVTGKYAVAMPLELLVKFVMKLIAVMPLARRVNFFLVNYATFADNFVETFTYYLINVENTFY